MKINTLKLPDRLARDLEVGPRSFDEEARERLRALIYGDPTAMIPKLYDVDGIIRANKLWSSWHRKCWLGKENPEIIPGNIDISKTLIFGHIEPDSPLALDYRSDVPCVIGFSDIDKTSYWLELSSSYGAFIDAVFRQGNRSQS
jgi:hypothetical protein